MKTDGLIKSMRGRVGIATIALLAAVLNISDQDQGSLAEMAEHLVSQFGIFAAAGMALYSKVREIIREKRGKLS